MIELDKSKAQAFLVKNNLSNFEIKKIAGDASFRSYYRVFFSGGSKVLMFAPPSHEDIRPFIKIDKFLIESGFSAPEIFAVDEQNGFILLEDFGDESYTKSLQSVPKNELQSREFDLYKNACDCLLAITKVKAPSDVENYTIAKLFAEVLLLVEWYFRLKNFEFSLAQKAQFKAAWFELFDQLSSENQVLVLRDYHADNLMIVKGRVGRDSVGMLDFQDALVGSAAYDLVSLLEDARRDLVEENRERLFKYYLDNYDGNKESFAADYEILSLQRNIKIIGIFSRLALRDGKPHYLNLLPRVIDFVRARLYPQNPSLSAPIFSKIGSLLKPFL